MNWLQLRWVLQSRKARWLELSNLVGDIKEDFPEVTSRRKYKRWIIGNRLEQSFSLLELLTFGARWHYFVGSCPVHCKVFNDIPGLYPLDISSMSTQLWQSKMSPDIFRWLLGRKWSREKRGVGGGGGGLVFSVADMACAIVRLETSMMSRTRLLRLDHGAALA